VSPVTGVGVYDGNNNNNNNIIIIQLFILRANSTAAGDNCRVSTMKQIKIGGNNTEM
jgi:hypothetical protein